MSDVAGAGATFLSTGHRRPTIVSTPTCVLPALARTKGHMATKCAGGVARGDGQTNTDVGSPASIDNSVGQDPLATSSISAPKFAVTPSPRNVPLTGAASRGLAAAATVTWWSVTASP